MMITLHGGPSDSRWIEVPDAPTEYVVTIEPTISELIDCAIRQVDPYPVRRAIYYRIGSTPDYHFSSILPWM